MVSLLDLAEITEEGVKFKSPHNGSEMMLTPEHSIQIQNCIGADIMMQLDDVVSSTTTGVCVVKSVLLFSHNHNWGPYQIYYLHRFVSNDSIKKLQFTFT